MSNLAYCTNVHAGTNLQETVRNLETYAPAVRTLFCPHDQLGIGLWLSAESARELEEQESALNLKGHLHDLGIDVVTMNGFPYGNFHADIVKHDVYEPHWGDPLRLEYTLQLAKLLTKLLPDGTSDASISTLPIGWGNSFSDESSLESAAYQLKHCVEELRKLHSETGICIHIDLEPEPGCVFDTANDVIEFFNKYLPRDLDRDYIRVCHDICHSAVMFEPQTAALRTYREHGVQVGKIQVSSAIEINFDECENLEQSMHAYSQFAEDRYLHQTTIQDNGAIAFFDDLPDALEQHAPNGTWRTHFHVPIFSMGTDLFSTTQKEIERCLASIPSDHPMPILEIETYAWNVLPSCLYEGEGISRGIAEEMMWLQDLLPRIRTSPEDES